MPFREIDPTLRTMPGESLCHSSLTWLMCPMSKALGEDILKKWEAGSVFNLNREDCMYLMLSFAVVTFCRNGSMIVG